MIQSTERRLLYVDDTEEQRYAMRRILEQAGFTVLEAGTGAEALRKLDPDILAVILDVKLPDMSGYDVCRRIKAAPETAAIPVLQVSASFADPTLRAAGLSGGADAYVAQPVHPAELLSLVNALIRSHESERTLRFQAEVSSHLSASIDYNETLRNIEQSFVPRFADRTFIVLRPPTQTPTHSASHPASHPPGHGTDDLHRLPGTNGLPSDLRAAALEIAAGAAARIIDRHALIVPMEVGRKRLGAIVFTLDGARRFFLPANLALARDLADRAALALQNSSLYTAQQNTQQALIQSEKIAAAGRLSAAMAHEINNPLESITNLIYLIDTSPEVTPTLKTYTQEALSELARLTHIARQSLGFYRELTGPTLFDLNDSVDDTLNIYLKRFRSRNIDVRRQYAPGPLNVFGVKGEIRQVISNLLVNAVDALSPGGTLLVETSACPERRSNQDGAEEAACFIFRVTDNGAGIPPHVLPHIFEPFFTTKDGTGTGLGLWVSDTIVTKHGGTIEVTTRTEGSDLGTTFEVTLPTSGTDIAAP